MLAIRMQRTGRKGHAQYRVIVQDSRRTPTSGNLVASLGHYNPHTKEHGVDLEKAKVYMDNGAQPSPRMAKFLQANGVKLPSWVSIDSSKSKKLRNQEKLRKNQPEEEIVVEVAPEEAPEQAVTEATPAEDKPEVAEKADNNSETAEAEATAESEAEEVTTTEEEPTETEEQASTPEPEKAEKES